MPAWLQGALAVAAFVVTASAIVARWGGRAARQDGAERTLDRAADATARHDVVDATMAATLAQLSRSLDRMEGKLDSLAAGHAKTREARVRHEAELHSLAQQGAARDARLDALEARVSRVDETQTAARHALRGEIQGWVSAGIGDALDLLRALIPGGGDAPRARRRG